MSSSPPPVLLLIAEDDPDDRLLTGDALRKGPLAHSFQFVNDGEELMDYLYHRGVYGDQALPRPSVILLDLNMPRKDGWEALEEIKQDATLRRIPIVVMTTSRAEEDILKSYDLGVNSFIVKPLVFERLVQIMHSLGNYWFEIVQLPPTE
jgi:two-component system, response regulator